MSLKGDRPGHARWRTMLEKHIDGELHAAQRLELFEHLEQCDECRETLEAEERLIDRLSRLPRLKAPSDLRASILKEVARERAEALMPVTEDSRYASVLRGESGSEGVGLKEEVGAGLRKTRGGHRRASIWRTPSSAFAVAFLIVAGTLNVLYQGGVSRFLPQRADSPTVVVSQVPLAAPVAEPATPSRSASNAQAGGDPSELSSYAEFGSSGSDQRAIIPISRGPEALEKRARDFAARTIPIPAEQQRPLTHVLVLRTTGDGKPGESAGKLAESLESWLESRTDGQILYYRQWEKQGRRFRSLTVDLSLNESEALLAALHDHCPEPAEIDTMGDALPPEGVAANVEVIGFAGSASVYVEALREAKLTQASPRSEMRRVCFVLPH